MTRWQERLGQNLERVRRRILEACERAGRPPEAVRLVAVTKGRSAEEVSELIRLGVSRIGENRVQEALAKKPRVSGAAEWHMVGHLQTNKVNRAMEVFQVLHSLDRFELARVLEKRHCTLPLLAEFNLTGNPNKHGFNPEEAEKVVSRLRREHPSLRLIGVMGMGPEGAAPEEIRPFFRKLAQISAAVGLPEISMGMSGDYPLAVEEGATLVRIGSALFEGIPPPSE